MVGKDDVEGARVVMGTTPLSRRRRTRGIESRKATHIEKDIYLHSKAKILAWIES